MQGLRRSRGKEVRSVGKIEDEVAQLIEFQYNTKTAFARKIGIPEQTLYSVLKSSLAGASMATVMPIANELDLDPFQLALGVVAPSSKTLGATDVPLFGSIAAGRPTDPDEADDVFPIPTRLHAEYPRAFMLRVDGTSMNRIMPDGSLALVDPNATEAESGKVYAISVGDTAATVKRVRRLSNGIALEPDSTDPTHHPIVLDYADEDAPTASVIGRVVWYCPPLDCDLSAL